MPPMRTVNLRRPITAVYTVSEAQLQRRKAEEQVEPVVAGPQSARPYPQARDVGRGPQPPTEELARLLTVLNAVIDSFHKLHEHAVASHPAELARLAVEIARRILMHKVGKGDYEIQTIVEEVLNKAPTAPKVVVHLNPEDLACCQELQRQGPQSPFAGLELTADRSIGRGECWVETSKGIVKSFIEEHLERISEALQRAQ